MTVEKIVHKDGTETIIVEVYGARQTMTMTEWSKAIANPRIVEE